MVGLGFAGTPPAALADKSWLYCPDKDVAWHRATVLSNYDPGNAGPGRRYESCNQDYAFQQGTEAVEAIMTGSHEDVYWQPERF